jgi:hypothetical protein
MENSKPASLSAKMGQQFQSSCGWWNLGGDWGMRGVTDPAARGPSARGRCHGGNCTVDNKVGRDDCSGADRNYPTRLVVASQQLPVG